MRISIMSTEYYQISVQEFKDLLKSLLKNKIVDKILTGTAKKGRFAVAPIMVTSEKDLDEFPLSQLFVWNYDKLNSAAKFLHKEGGAIKERVAVIGHPCDGRALVELAKRLQVKMENVFLIIMEDIGTITSKDIGKFLKSENIDETTIVDEFLSHDTLFLKTKDGKVKEYKLGDKINVNENCTRCYRKKLQDNYDFGISFIGTEPFSNQIILHVNSQKGSDALKASGLKLVSLAKEKADNYIKIQNQLIESAKQCREKELNEWLNTKDRIKEIAKCTMCNMCIMSCPVCFCKSCILQQQRKEKTIDKLSYQLTRISHVGDACVGCGKCDQNCPQGLPLSLYFQSVNDEVLKKFGYEAGCNLNSIIPRSKESIKKVAHH